MYVFMHASFRSIAKTSSGKIARQWVRRAYLQGASSGSDGSGYGSGGLKVVAEWNVALDSANAATGGQVYSSAADDGLEAATAAVPRSTTIDYDHDHQDGSSSSGVSEAIDPTGLSVNEVLPQLQRAVAECLEAQAAEAQIDAGGSHRAQVVAVEASGLSPDGKQTTSHPFNPFPPPLTHPLIHPHTLLTCALNNTVSLVALGMDSMRGIQLQALLEAMFTVQLPDELMFEPDATLRTLAMALVSTHSSASPPRPFTQYLIVISHIPLPSSPRQVSGGHVKQRPVMIDVWKLVAASRKRAAGQPKGRPLPRGPLPPQWFKEHEVKADVDSHSFPDGCALRPAPLSLALEIYLCFLSLLFYGVFVWVPCLLVLLVVVLPRILPQLVPLPVAVAIAAVGLAGVYALPWDCWPPAAALRLGFDYETTCAYFSYRVIVEKKNDMLAAAASAVAVNGGGSEPGVEGAVPSIFTFGKCKV